MISQSLAQPAHSIRLKLTLSPMGRELFDLPVDHNQLLQAFIYSNADRVLAEWLHNEGYHHDTDKRKFKLFTFSRLLSDTPRSCAMGV